MIVDKDNKIEVDLGNYEFMVDDIIYWFDHDCEGASVGLAMYELSPYERATKYESEEQLEKIKEYETYN